MGEIILACVLLAVVLFFARRDPKTAPHVEHFEGEVVGRAKNVYNAVTTPTDGKKKRPGVVP